MPDPPLRHYPLSAHTYCNAMDTKPHLVPVGDALVHGSDGLLLSVKSTSPSIESIVARRKRSDPFEVENDGDDSQRSIPAQRHKIHAAIRAEKFSFQRSCVPFSRRSLMLDHGVACAMPTERHLGLRKIGRLWVPHLSRNPTQISVKASVAMWLCGCRAYW